jgi:hypothetical protein
MGAQRLRRTRFALLCAALSASVFAVTCQPPPDPDGQPGGARLMGLGTLQADALHCRAGDCADWFRLLVEDPGDLIVMVESPVGAVDGRALAVVLADGRARQLQRQRVSASGGDAVITWKVERGFYMVRVESNDEAKTPLPYELSLSLVLPPPPAPPPPPPEPRFDTVDGEVLEVEGDLGDPEAVLFDLGETHGILPGQRGRLKNEEETIATVVVVDTYPDGSRARIEGTLTAPISPATRIEIDVPLGDRP